MREIHAKHGVAGLQECEIHRDVGGCSGVRLDVGKFAIKKFFRTITSNVFYDVRILLTPVIALARIALGVFVGEV